MKLAVVILLLLNFSCRAHAADGEDFARLSDASKVQRFAIKLSTVDYHYEEPGLMRIHGRMYGVEGGWRNTFHLGNWTMPYGLNANLLLGKNIYDGGVVYKSGLVTPESAPSHDLISDYEGFLGAALIDSEYHELDFRAGPGLWFLFNRIDGTGSYTRQIVYLYLPVSLRYAVRISPCTVTLGAQYDTFLYGYVHSALSELGGNYDDVDNNQTSGSGYRFTAGFEYAFANWSLLVDGFYKAWNIANSDSQYSAGAHWREPHNTTRMIGINAGVRF